MTNITFRRVTRAFLLKINLVFFFIILGCASTLWLLEIQLCPYFFSRSSIDSDREGESENKRDQSGFGSSLLVLWTTKRWLLCELNDDYWKKISSLNHMFLLSEKGFCLCHTVTEYWVGMWFNAHNPTGKYNVYVYKSEGKKDKRGFTVGYTRHFST